MMNKRLNTRFTRIEMMCSVRMYLYLYMHQSGETYINVKMEVTWINSVFSNGTILSTMYLLTQLYFAYMPSSTSSLISLRIHSWYPSLLYHSASITNRSVLSGRRRGTGADSGRSNEVYLQVNWMEYAMRLMEKISLSIISQFPF